MLIDMVSNQVVDYIPHLKEYQVWMERLDIDEQHQIFDRLNEMVDGTEIQTAGWMPGNNWEGTVFQPIHDKAARGSLLQSGQCFGLMVWVMFMEREESWYFGKFEKDGFPIGSMTYFQRG